MIFIISISAVLITIIGNGLYNKYVYKKHITQDTSNPISVSYSALSEDEAERAFFDTETRIMLYPKYDNGITAFYLDDQLTGIPLNGYYCDGFFIISIVDHGVSFKELT